MPIAYRIDAGRRVVFADPYGALTAEDLFAYQRDVGSKPQVRGFDELVDMSRVEQVVYTDMKPVRELASLSASMDDPDRPTRLAIVAPADEDFGLGRMYEALRSLQPGSTREVRVFRKRADALAWLGTTDPPDRVQ
jgi:hypothetical protein